MSRGEAHEEERERLQHVLRVIARQLQERVEARERHKGRIRETREWMQDELPDTIRSFDDAIEWAQALQQANLEEDEHHYLALPVRQLQRLLERPYFARFDFLEEGTKAVEAVYVGVASLVDEQTGEHLIYDWRSPLASMYYDFPVGPAYFDCPAGRIHGEILTKRQYRIVRGELQGVFDAGLHLGDDVLQEMASHTADRRMRSIVATIQREQNAIIRDEGTRTLIVQGVAGSGKTAIALQRAAWLLYHHRQRVRSNQLLILSPNLILGDYISEVLPELGEENVRQSTLHMFAKAKLGDGTVLESPFAKFEPEISLVGFGMPVDPVERKVAAQFKQSEGFADLLERYAQHLARTSPGLPEVSIDGETVVSEAEFRRLFLETYAFLPYLRRFESILDVVAKRCREHLRDRIYARVGKDGWKRADRESRARMEELWPDICEQLAPYTEQSVFGLYGRLFEDASLFEQAEGGVWIRPDDWNGVRAVTRLTLRRDSVPAEDVAGLLFLHLRLWGGAETDILHVLVDEAQDYTSMQHRVLREMFSNAQYTLLGDVSQRLEEVTPWGDQPTLARLYGDAGARLVTLTQTYRSSGPIVRFSQGLLSSASLKEGQLLREGTVPVLCVCTTRQRALDRVLAFIAEAAEEDIRSLAIITRTSTEAWTVHSLLNEALKGTRQQHRPPLLRPLSSEDTVYRAGFIVAPVHLAKGLEYDRVVVWGVDEGSFAEDARTWLYVACTRALHQLALISVGKPSVLVERLEPSHYRREEVPPQSRT